MINHIIDHALTTIGCTLDGMEAINQMMMEVERPNPEAIGYLMLDCIASIRQECATIEAELENYCK
jgi:hypothetical protein